MCSCPQDGVLNAARASAERREAITRQSDAVEEQRKSAAEEEAAAEGGPAEEEAAAEGGAAEGTAAAEGGQREQRAADGDLVPENVQYVRCLPAVVYGEGTYDARARVECWRAFQK